jgi:mannose-6-phosphate isomerase-like protein (cupin superfamily)
MKKALALATVVAVAVALFGTTEVSAQDKMKQEVVGWSPADMKWIEMKGGPPGAMYSNLWGDLTTGGYGSLVKLPGGMNNPPHSHTNDTKLVVISGTFWYATEGGKVTKLGPGSYLLMPAGVKHTSGTAEGSACEIFQESSGLFDFVPAAAPPMEKKADKK